MKQLLLVLLLAFTLATLLADTPQPPAYQEAPMLALSPRAMQRQDPPPSYSFAVEPVSVLTNYYDYMPGSYISTPLQVQNNNPAGQNGCYAVFHGRETAAAQRREYICYINSNGEVTYTGFMGNNEVWEGYGSCSIDPDTQDPLVVYHVDFGQPTARVDMSYDMYSVLQGPGLLAGAFTIIDNQTIAGVQTPFSDDSFVWPYVYVIKAPTYDVDGKRRALVFANNNTSQTENPSENVLLAWADYTTSDLDNATMNALEWSYYTFPLLDGYNAGNPSWGRYNKSIAVGENGQVAMIGYLSADEYTDGRSRLTIFYNDNYGEGDWEVVQEVAGITVENPLKQDGSPQFEADEIFFDFVNSSHPHATFDSEGRLHFIGNMVLGYLDENNDHYLWAYYSYLKDVIYNPSNGEIIWQDLYPQSDAGVGGYPFIPWDVDNDGQVDEFDDEGNVMSVYGWPIYWWVWDDAFHENLFKYSTSSSKRWMAAVWLDGLNSRYYNEDSDEEYAQWANVPEICIAVSGEFLAGRTDGHEWTEPIRLNSLETPELAGIIPEYVYPGSYIERINGNIGRLHLFFLDDNAYGSFVQGNGANDGGTMMYCAIDIEFSDADVDDSAAPDVHGYGLRAYPNPFNPTTQVSFSLAAPDDISLTLYNVRGQKVKTLTVGHYEAGTHDFTWNGCDDDGAPVASSVYFARVEGQNGAQTSKLLLLK